MKKMKKFLAMFLAMAMVLGMSITSFAAGTATITINNAGTGATFKMKQIIAPDTEEPTGWAFVNGAGAAYRAAFGMTDEQAIIWKLIKLADPEATNIPDDVTPATTKEIQSALSTVISAGGLTEFTNGGSVSEAGVYVIDALETGYSYSPMAAYVAFSAYNTTTGVPANLANATVEAKRVDTSIEKTSDEEDDVVFVGDTVTYTITTTVPYIPENVENVVYGITDVIKGAVYVTEEGVVTLKVSVGGEDPVEYTAEVTEGEEAGSQTFRVDLSAIASNRANANQSLVITYDAMVTGTVVNNSAVPDDGQNTFTPATDGLYTASITMTKTGENNEPLENAEFIIYTTRNNQVMYAIVNDNNNVTGWTTTEADASHVKTIEDGTVTVKGFDDSEMYYFKEVVAPQGYSLNATDSPTVWATTAPGNVPATRSGNATMSDTQLNSLPSTGGIGTTIFTIGGCAIMIIAAGLYFSLRRRTAK